MRRCLLVVLLFLSASASAQRYSRNVDPAAPGPNRLDVDAALLARSQPGLADLRLRAPSGEEVPYLLIEPPAEEPAWARARTLPIAPTKKASGFEADLGATRRVDRIRLHDIGAPFLKRVRIEGSGDRARWTLLADATVFDLPEEKLRNLDVAFPASELRYVRATWDDRSSAPVGASRVSLRLHGTGASPEPLLVPVPFRKRSAGAGKSRYRVTLPGPHLQVTALELRVGSGDVFRQASVTEPRLREAQVVPELLGSGTLRRAARPDGVAADMKIPVTSPRGRDLDVIVDDASNAPLALDAIVAHLAPQPWIYFESKTGAPLVASVGDPRLAAPRYDVEASRKFAETAAVARATWSDPGPALQAEPTAAPSVPFVGAAVVRSQFRHSRAIASSDPGLTVLLPDAEVLAHTNDLADARIVDGQDRQIMYLVERREEPLVIELRVPERETIEGRSRYRLALPYEKLPYGSRIVITTPARVFERYVELREAVDSRGGRGAATIGSTTWRSADPESAPPTLTFNAPMSGAREVDLLLDEGDNAPLPIAAARLLVPSSGLRFFHPGGDLTLLYGANVAAPRYDLALLAPRLLGESARDIALAQGPAPETAEPKSKERAFFWIALAAAAVVLLGLLSRLLRTRQHETPPVGDRPDGGDSPR